ncbi:ACP S-malonyltransferase [Nocardioides humi]|nr:hypothetical protein [Nocardioides humi]
MAPAVDHVTRLARSVSAQDARTPFLSNADGAVVRDGGDVLSRIVGQIARPVRWDLCLEAMTRLGVTGILELPPAGTLTGIAKRYFRGGDTTVETLSLNTPDQLDEAHAFCERHRAAVAAEAVSA